ncbi:MAG TPA: TfpX/TfpZ family type IV pilin accessory protein [Dokdonella sp.]|nr:TfpX/TfpZ family type IV pilin accessory protein [Dokdonella sp.]
MSRWKAASIHLSISIAVGLLVFALLFLVWFPQPYFNAAGGQHLILVLLGVDLVLGPMLTLILFKSGKNGMLFDLCMIGLMQSAALVYGMHVITESRPVFVVAVVDRFNVITPADLDPSDLAEGTKPEFRSLSWTGPKIIAAQLPQSGEERTHLMFQGPGGKDVQNYPKYYVDYHEEAQNLRMRAKPITSLRSAHPDAMPILDQWFADHLHTESEVVWMPVVTRNSGFTMLLDKRTGEVLDALPIYAW